MNLFPAPNIPKHPKEPRPLPGATAQSTTLLQDVLQENHARFHALFNDAPLHNHISHHVIALWWLGASPERIQEAYDLEIDDQRSVNTGITPDVVSITAENFMDHIGHHKFYHSYLMFFEQAVEEQGMVGAFEKYVLSPEYNLQGSSMLNSFYEGLIHPFIHVGYGLEFGLPGMVSEGLAMAAITGPRARDSLLPSFITAQSAFLQSSPSITQKLASLSFLSSPTRTSAVESPRSPSTPHALTFLPRIDADEECHDVPMTAYFDEEFCERFRGKMEGYVREWIGEGCDQAGFQELLWKKVEELIWLCTVIYAVGGPNSKAEDKEGEGGGLQFTDDFYTMHLVTSALFLPSYIHSLTHHPNSALALLQSYFTNSLLWYIARRSNTPLSIANFYAKTSHLRRHHPLTKGVNNVWTPIIETSIAHEDEHLPKLTRALMHFATHYGRQTFSDIFDLHREDIGRTVDPSLEVFERLDGTLFWRAAVGTVVRFPGVGGGRGKGMVERASGCWDGLGGIDPGRMAREENGLGSAGMGLGEGDGDA